MSSAFNTTQSALSTIIRWLGITLLRLLAAIIVGLLLVLALPVNFLGGFILRRDSHIFVPEVGFRNWMHTFRDDLIDILSQHHSPSNRNRQYRQKLRTQIAAEHQRAKARAKVGESAITFWGGIIAAIFALFGTWPTVGKFLSLLIVVITASIILQTVVLEMLAFGEGEVKSEYDRTRLELMLGWNRGILNSSKSQIFIVLLVLLGWVKGDYWHLAKKIISNHAEDRYQ